MNIFSHASVSRHLAHIGWIALVAISPAPAALIDGGFESGTTGWTESGGSGNFTVTSSLNGLYQTINPNADAQFAVISNDGIGAEFISQTITVPSGSSALSISYLFLTDGLNDPAFNDSARAVLTPSIGVPLTLFTVSRDTLQASGAGPLLPGAQYFDIQTISQSAWQTSVTDISAFAGKNATLTFQIDNGDDSDFLLESRLAIDSVSVASVPEAGSMSLLLPMVGALAIFRRRR